MADKPLSMRVPIELLKKIDEQASQRQLNRKEFVVACLNRAMDETESHAALVASIDRVGQDIVAVEARLNEKLAKGTAELNDRLTELEEMQLHHLFNFLAYVSPDIDTEKAAARGQERLINTIKTVDAIRQGKITGLRQSARAEISDEHHDGGF